MVEVNWFLALSAVAGVFLGWGLSLVNFGKKEQAEKDSLTRSHEKTTDLEVKYKELTAKLDELVKTREAIAKSDMKLEEHGKEIAELRAAIKEVLSLFKVGDEPRFMTRPACLGMQEHCHAIAAEKDKLDKARFGNLESTIREIRREQKDNLEVLVEEIRKVKK